MRRSFLRLGLILAAAGALVTVVAIPIQIPAWRRGAAADRLAGEAEACYRRGDSAGTMEKLNEALALSPDHLTARRGRGLELLRASRLPEALEDLRFVARARPWDAGSDWELAFALLTAGRNDEAEEWFQRVLRVERSNGVAAAMIANCRMLRGDSRGALEWAVRAVKLSPRVPLTYVTLGLVRQQMGDLEGARQAWEEALRLRPSDIRTILSLASVTGKLHRFDLAVEHLERAVRIRPEEPILWVSLGTALYGNRQPDEARKAFGHALALDPQNRLAHIGLEQLQRLHP